MKLKYNIIILFLISASLAYSQKPESIYRVAIFKWTKTENNELKKFVLIDSLGNIYVDNKNSGKRINLKSFTKSINEFVKDKSVEKVPGSDNPPRVATPPKIEEQNIYFTVSFLDDFHNEKKLGTMTSYHNRNEKLKPTEANYLLYKYLNKKDLSVLEKMLK